MAEEKKPDKDLTRSKIEGEISETGEIPRSAAEIRSEVGSEKKETAAEKEDAYSKILAKVKEQTPIVNEASVHADAKLASAGETSEAKINNLVNLAMQKGVVYAVKVARHLEDNYTLDEMHDRLLADEFHTALIKKGLLKEL